MLSNDFFFIKIFLHDCLAVGDVKYPKFTGDGFLALPTVTSGYTEFEILIKFKPSTDSGLLLFISEYPDAKGDFFSLGLINGFVEFRFVNCSLKSANFSRKSYEDMI